MLMTFEEQVAEASEAAAADAYRAAFDPPARLWQPQRMTADEHAAVIRNSLSHGREVRYWVGQKQYKQKVSEFAWECLINDDSVTSLLTDAMRIEASGASDADIASAFKRFCKASADCAGVAAEAIDEERGFFTYLYGSRS